MNSITLIKHVFGVPCIQWGPSIKKYARCVKYFILFLVFCQISGKAYAHISNSDTKEKGASNFNKYNFQEVITGKVTDISGMAMSG